MKLQKRLPPKLSDCSLSELMSDVELGRIKIPQFQRNYEWNVEKTAKLFDSVIKGYPIGTFTFWRTNQEFRFFKEITNANIDTSNEYTNYVLDGQQRIISLFSAFKGSKTDYKNNDFTRIFINLNAKIDEQIVFVLGINQRKSPKYIPLHEILHSPDYVRYEKFKPQIENYKRVFSEYRFSIITVSDIPLEMATEIYERVNTSGIPLKTFDIMLAKTYDNEKGFDLEKKFSELKKKLKPVSYSKIEPITVLKLMAILYYNKGKCTKKDIFKIPKNYFIENWDLCVVSIETAIEHFRTHLRIPSISYLPREELLIPFAYYFSKTKRKPDKIPAGRLKAYFWRAAISDRYSSGVDMKLEEDIKEIYMISTGQKPRLEWEYKHRVKPEYIIENGDFSRRNSFIRTILCLLVTKEPKSFDDDSTVITNNNYLRKKNSKNYHHFFPKAFLKSKKIDESKINHIANITIISSEVNQKVIRDKKPSKYMRDFRGSNPNIDKTMKTHLINDIDSFGINDDNYDKFFEARVKAISDELRKRTILR